MENIKIFSSLYAKLRFNNDCPKNCLFPSILPKMVIYEITDFILLKDKICFAVFLILAFSFVLSIIAFSDVNAAKLQSGVTINPPSSTTGTCPDANSDGVNDMTGLPCGAPTGTTGTCGLQIVSGAPINYGQLNIGQVSTEQKVTIKNTGNAPAKVMVKAGDWMGGPAAGPVKLYGPEITRVAVTPAKEFGNKFPLHTAEATILGDLGAGQSGDSYWSLYADPKLSGSPTQEVTIDLTC